MPNTLAVSCSFSDRLRAARFAARTTRRAGETYRNLCGASAEEDVIDATIAAAKKRAAVEREGMRQGAVNFVACLRRSSHA